MALDEGHVVTQREAEHAQVSPTHDISTEQFAPWAGIRLVHQALPDVDLGGTDTSTVYPVRRCAAVAAYAAVPYLRNPATGGVLRRGGRTRPGPWRDTG